MDFFYVFHTCYMSFRSCLGVMTRITYCKQRTMWWSSSQFSQSTCEIPIVG